MKKIIFVIALILLLSGCSMMRNTPTSAVEEWLNNYQTNNEPLIERVNNWLNDQKLSDEDRKLYKSALDRQYSNFSYEIKNENVIDDTAEVEVEIEVLDYNTSIKKSREYFSTNQEEFIDNKVDDNDIDTLKEFIEYKIKELMNVEDKTKYNITFYLSKTDNEWYVKDLSNDDFLKLYGLY